MSIFKDALFNEEAQRREMGTANSDNSRALVSKGSRERDQSHQRGTGRVRPRS